MAPAKYVRRKDEGSSSHEIPLQAELCGAIKAKLVYSLGKTTASATDRDWYQATALAIRDRVIDIWMQAKGGAKRERKKRVYYLSIESLVGRLLFDSLSNLRIVEATRAARVDLDHLREIEPDPALGNGGLGRLAACFMDSMWPSASPLMATAFVTRTGCSSSASMGIQWTCGALFRRIWRHQLTDIFFAMLVSAEVSYRNGLVWHREWIIERKASAAAELT